MSIKYIYVAKVITHGMFKVGISEKPIQRMHALSQEHRCMFELLSFYPAVNGFETENSIHKALAAHRTDRMGPTYTEFYDADLDLIEQTIYDINQPCIDNTAETWILTHDIPETMNKNNSEFCIHNSEHVVWRAGAGFFYSKVEPIKLDPHFLTLINQG